MILSGLGQGKRNVCFEMTKVRLFKDLKKKFKSSIRILRFFNESIWSNFSFFLHGPFFFRNIWMELKKRPLSIRQSSKCSYIQAPLDYVNKTQMTYQLSLNPILGKTYLLNAAIRVLSHCSAVSKQAIISVVSSAMGFSHSTCLPYL